MGNRYGAAWVMRLPPGLRNQPGWIFVGLFAFLAGLSYLLGIAESTTITKVLNPGYLRLWGGVLCLSGALVVGATWAANTALERMSLRFLSLSILVYMGWVLAAVPVQRAVMVVALCLVLVVLAEIRVAVLTAAMRPLPARHREVR